MDNKEYFLQELRKCERQGVDLFIGWLESTDFFESPASTRFHGSHEGGLLEHSLNVYKAAMMMYNSNLFSTHEIGENSVRICALLHDVCKAMCYATEWKWTKDDNNKWIQYPAYTFNERQKFGGHGSKSLYFILRYINLSFEEAAAINCHMGAYDNPKVGDVYEENKLAWLIHVADEWATYYMDGK